MPAVSTLTREPDPDLKMEECDLTEHEQNMEMDSETGKASIEQEMKAIVIKPEPTANEGVEQMDGFTGFLGNGGHGQEMPEMVTERVQYLEPNIEKGNSEGYYLGAPKRDYPDCSKYCLECEKRIRQSGRQAKSYPHKIGKTLVNGYLQYLQAIGKPKTRNEVLDRYLCSRCHSQYYMKYRKGKCSSALPGPGGDHQILTPFYGVYHQISCV